MNADEWRRWRRGQRVGAKRRVAKRGKSAANRSRDSPPTRECTRGGRGGRKHGRFGKRADGTMAHDESGGFQARADCFATEVVCRAAMASSGRELRPSTRWDMPIAAVPDDAQHDAYLSLEAWVEKGSAPESMIAAKYDRRPLPQTADAPAHLCVSQGTEIQGNRRHQ